MGGAFLQEGGKALTGFIGAAHTTDGLGCQLSHFGGDRADFKLRKQLLDLVLCIGAARQQGTRLGA